MATAVLVHLGTHTLACDVHGEDTFDLFAARTTLTHDDIECHEGKRIVFVAPEHIPTLDLTDATRALYPLVVRGTPSSARP